MIFIRVGEFFGAWLWNSFPLDVIPADGVGSEVCRLSPDVGQSERGQVQAKSGTSLQLTRHSSPFRRGSRSDPRLRQMMVIWAAVTGLALCLDPSCLCCPTVEQQAATQQSVGACCDPHISLHNILYCHKLASISPIFEYVTLGILFSFYLTFSYTENVVIIIHVILFITVSHFHSCVSEF